LPEPSNKRLRPQEVQKGPENSQECAKNGGEVYVLQGLQDPGYIENYSEELRSKFPKFFLKNDLRPVGEKECRNIKNPGLPKALLR